MNLPFSTRWSWACLRMIGRPLKTWRIVIMNMSPVALRSAVRSLLTCAIQSRLARYFAAAVCLIAASAAGAPPEGLPPGFPEIELPATTRGEAAISALGNRLPAVAAFYRKSNQELRVLLREDRSLWVDQHGRLLYVCELGSSLDETEGSGDDSAVEAAAFTYDQTFLLHSRPGATRVIYLDFDGHSAVGTSWGNNAIAPPFDLDGDPSTFNTTERDRIYNIWLRVAEDFAQYDIDVTTEDPGVEALRKTSTGDVSYGIRVVIGGASSDWYGSGAGGVAYVGSFDWNSDTPCWVFPRSLSNSEKNIAEAASHEAGHTLGLSHDGTTTGTEYYGGHGNWAPIMGVGYSRPITQWSKGEYANANRTQDDLAVMLNEGISYRADDHGNTLATATPLAGIPFTATGVIERNTDVDFFSFQTGAGRISITATPAPRGANLRLLISLYNNAGALMTSTNVADTSAGVLPVTLTTVVPGGSYYFSIDGIGSGNPLTDGYSDYASLGAYTITGTIPSDSGWIATAEGANYAWTNAANWASNSVPNAIGVTARVANNILGDQIIRMNGPVTVGRLFLGDANSTHAFELAGGTGGSLRFHSLAGNASVVKTAGLSDVISASVLLQTNLAVTNASAQLLTLSGPVSGMGGITKAGAGVLLLDAANSFSGATIVAAGTLALGPNGTLASSMIEVRAGAALDGTDRPGGLLIGNARTLAGGGMILGNATIAGGARLAPGGIEAAGTLSFAGNLQLSHGAMLEFDLAGTGGPGGGTNDLLVVHGDLELTGTVQVAIHLLEGLLESPGTYTLIAYAGALAGGAANLAFTASSNRYAATFDDSVPGEIRVHISGAPAPLAWRGDGSANRWEIGGAAIWLQDAAPETFHQLDSVVFGEEGSNAPSINLIGALRPAGVVVNSAKNYTFAGTGKLSGNASLHKQGASLLTMSTANDYDGVTLIESGILRIGHSAALGSPAGETVITAPGRLDLNAFSLGAEPIFVQGTGGAVGAIINGSGTAQPNALRFVTLTGDTTFAGASRWDIRANPTGHLLGNNFNLTKIGANEIWLAHLGGTGLGDITINQGLLGIQGSTTLGDPQKTLTLAAGTTLALMNTDNNIVNKRLAWNGGTIRSDSGNNLMTGGGTLAGNSTVSVSSILAYQGPLGGAGNLTKTGAGMFSLGTSNSFTGVLTINAGTVRAGNAWALGATNGATIIASGGRLDVNAQNLGAERVTVQGTGLGSAGAILNNSTTAQNNALRFVTLSGHTTFGGIGRWDIRANPTATFTGNNFNLTKAGPNEVWLVDVGASGLANITVSKGLLGVQGSTTLGNAGNTVTVSSGASLGIWGTGTNVLNKTTTLSSGRLSNGSGANTFAGNISMTGSNRFDTASGTSLTLRGTLSGTGAVHKLGSGTLILGANNTYSGFTLIGAGTLQVGSGADAGTLGSSTITNNATLTFNRSNSFSVGNVITGTGALNKQGAGTLTLNGANTFTGLTTVSAGTLAAGNASAFGATSSGVTVANGATLDINGLNLGAEPVSVIGSGVGAAGAIVNNSATAQISALRFVTLTGNATFGGYSRWDLRDPGAGGASSLTGNNFNLTKAGTNHIWLVNVGNTGLGDIIVNGGLLGLQGTTTLGTASRTAMVAPNGTLAFALSGANVLTKLLSVNGGQISNPSGSNTFAGPATLIAAPRFDVGAGATLHLAGAVGGSGSLTKTGSGRLVLAANNSFGGNTLVSAGTLALNHAGALASTPAIVLEPGAILDASGVVGGWTLPPGRTLSGNGTIIGSIAAAGIISPGASVGSLNFSGPLLLNGSVIMDVVKTGDALGSDVISVSGSLTCGGALTVRHSGDALVEGDVFQLFNAGGFSGAFSDFDLPTLPNGLRWDATKLAVNGTLRVAPRAAPEILPVQFDGTNLLVQVQSDAGATYVLEWTLDLQPPANWIPVATNAGTGQLLLFSVPVEAAPPQRYLRVLSY